MVKRQREDDLDGPCLNFMITHKGHYRAQAKEGGYKKLRRDLHDRALRKGQTNTLAALLELYERFGQADWEALSVEQQDEYKSSEHALPMLKSYPAPTDANKFEIPPREGWAWKLNGEIPGFGPEDDKDVVGSDETWTRSKQLGQGAQGAVYLWVSYDNETGNIRDRIAVKEIRSYPRDLYQPYHTAIPSEVAAMQLLDQVEQTPYIIEFLGARQKLDRRYWRICMEVAPFGSTSGFMTQWMELHKDERMPENFFIDMFAAMMKAGQHMLDRNLVHNDIKAGNICFLENDDYDVKSVNDSWTKWPVKPVVIDFGLARPIKSEKFPKEDTFLDWGTDGHRPPEQVSSMDSRKNSLVEAAGWKVRIGEKAMVFSFAATMFKLMHPRRSLPQFHEERPPGVQGLYHVDLYNDKLDQDADIPIITEHFRRQRPNTTKPSDALYPALTSLLSACLRFRPQDRPTFANVLDTIKRFRPVDSGMSPDQIAAGVDLDWNRTFAIDTTFDAEQVTLTVASSKESAEDSEEESDDFSVKTEDSKDEDFDPDVQMEDDEA